MTAATSRRGFLGAPAAVLPAAAIAEAKLQPMPFETIAEKGLN